MERSSEYLKEALKVKVGNDENGNPVLIAKRKPFLALLGIKRKGEKEFSIKIA